MQNSVRSMLTLHPSLVLLHKLRCASFLLGKQMSLNVQQVLMYYGSGTVDRIASGQPADVLHTTAGGCSGRQTNTACSLTADESSFCASFRTKTARNDVIAAILKV